MFHCYFGVFKVDMCKSLLIFEQTDHSDRSDDHARDLTEVHECDAVLSDGRKQIDMQRQGITGLLTVKQMFTKEERKEIVQSATKNLSWQRAKCVFIINKKPYIFKAP